MFERDSRVSRLDSPLWWMDVGEKKRDARWVASAQKRRLIIEPYAMRGSSYPLELRVWIEQDSPQYIYAVKSISTKPKGLPTFRIEQVVIENSQRNVRAKTGLESVVIAALASQQLTGDAAKSAVNNLFWTHFVEDDDGLTWLYKYASKEVGNFYAGQRLDGYVRAYDSGRGGAWQAANAVRDVLKGDYDLAERMAQRVVEDEALQHAIEALLMTDEDEDAQHANIRRIIELSITDKDFVFAGIVSASRGTNALRGLRACQRAEHDPEFFEAVAAIARRERSPTTRSKCINAFLHKSRMKP